MQGRGYCGSASRAALAWLSKEEAQRGFQHMVYSQRLCMPALSAPLVGTRRPMACSSRRLLLRRMATGLQLCAPERAQYHHFHVEPGEIHVWWLHPEDVRLPSPHLQPSRSQLLLSNPQIYWRVQAVEVESARVGALMVLAGDPQEMNVCCEGSFHSAC